VVVSRPMKRKKNLHPMIKKYISRVEKRRSAGKKSTCKAVVLEYFFYYWAALRLLKYMRPFFVDFYC